MRHVATAPARPPVQRIGIGELPSIFPEDEFGVPITDSQFATPARAKGFDDTAQALKDGAFSDERVMPTLSTKNGGMLSTLDVRGDRMLLRGATKESLKSLIEFKYKT